MSSGSERPFQRIGISMALLGLAINPITIGFFFAPGGRITTMSWTLFVILCETLLIIGGAAVWTRSNTLDQKTFRLALMTFLITIAVTETGLHIIRHLVHPNEYRGIGRRSTSSVYEHKSWADSLFKEYGELDLELEPSVGWRTRAHHGQYINVDSVGMRKTFQPGMIEPADSSFSIYCFGGSAMWGSYVRDRGTIPSFISQMLRAGGIPCSVCNYGEQGYTFGQEVIRLTLLLREGHRPKSVLFYDGVNDVISSYYSGRADAPLSQLEERVGFMKLPYLTKLGVLTRDFLEQHLLLFIAFDRIVRLLFGSTHGRFSKKVYSPAELDELSRAIVRQYKTSYDLLVHLSAAYHFKIFCFLQPVIFTRANPTAEELHGDEHVHDEALKKLCLDTYSLLKQSGLPKYDLSDALNEAEGTYYVDFCHLSEEGNQVVAAKIARILSDQTGGYGDDHGAPERNGSN